MGCSDDPADLGVKLDALLARSAAERPAIGAYPRTKSNACTVCRDSPGAFWRNSPTLSPARFLQALGNVRRGSAINPARLRRAIPIAAYWLAAPTPPLFQQQFRFHWRHHPFWRGRPTAWRSRSSSFKSNTVSSHAASGNGQR